MVTGVAVVEQAGSDRHDGAGFDIDRRRLLKRTAVVGGAMWAAPALLTVDRASAAELHSAPPAGGTAPSPAQVRGAALDRPASVAQVPGGRPAVASPPAVSGQAATGQPAAAGGPAVVGGQSQVAASALPTARAGTLPRTGGDIDKLVGTGLAAVASGGLLNWWSADRAALGAPVADAPTGPAD